METIKSTEKYSLLVERLRDSVLQIQPELP